MSKSFIYSDLIRKLEEKIDEAFKNRERILISVVGKRGTGKSHFGKFIRKNGIGKYGKKMISVIDDGLTWLDFFFFFRKRLKIPCSGVDELKPFLDKISPNKKIIFYINATPWTRVSEVDILLKLTTNEATRIERLKNRYKNKPQTLNRAINTKEIEDYKIRYTYFLEVEV